MRRAASSPRLIILITVLFILFILHRTTRRWRTPQTGGMVTTAVCGTVCCESWWWGGMDFRRLWTPRLLPGSCSRRRAGTCHLLWRMLVTLYVWVCCWANVALFVAFPEYGADYPLGHRYIVRRHARARTGVGGVDTRQHHSGRAPWRVTQGRGCPRRHARRALTPRRHPRAAHPHADDRAESRPARCRRCTPTLRS